MRGEGESWVRERSKCLIKEDASTWDRGGRRPSNVAYSPGLPALCTYSQSESLEKTEGGEPR